MIQKWIVKSTRPRYFWGGEDVGGVGAEHFEISDAPKHKRIVPGMGRGNGD